MISHMAASRVNVVAEGLAGDHGETDESPMPVPSATSSSVTATAVRAPPMIAAQDTAEEDRGASSSTTTATDSVASAMLRPLMPEKREQDDNRDRHAKQPEKNATAHFLVLQRVMEWA